MRSRAIATVIGAACAAFALSASSASGAWSQHSWQNWSRTPTNSAGVVFHPHGDYFEVWDNSATFGLRTKVKYNYVGINDRWKTAVSLPDRHPLHVWTRHNLIEHKHIYFYIEDLGSPSYASEYRTSGR